MESANLTPPPGDDAELETLLRTPEPTLPDDGFTARVVAALPAPQPLSWTRFWCGAGGGVLGLVLAWLKGASWEDLATAMSPLVQSVGELGGLSADPWLWCAITVTAACLVFTLRDTDAEPGSR